MSQKLLLRALSGEVLPRPPVWLMRQAGRYLPEYRAVRAGGGSFLDLCYSPELAAEVTLQPIRRFGFDASILFSDILVIPDALGQGVRFEENVGPILSPRIEKYSDLAILNTEKAVKRLAPVYETVRLLRKQLPSDVCLIGFAGAPWTVATYMIAGAGSRDQMAARLWAYRDPEGFAALINILVQVTAEYLIGQVRAGVEVLQIFDTWAGSLPEPEFRRWCIAPTKEIIRLVHQEFPDMPVIGFPKGAGPLYQDYSIETGVAGISVDPSMALKFVRDHLQSSVTVQGNLDPLLLVAGGAAMLREAERILSLMNNGPFIFNLGHGIVPETPPENVGELVKFIKQWQS